MAHDHKLLQKIFRELESQLSQVLASNSSGDHHHHHHHHNPSDIVDFEQRLAFFNTLLRAEMTLHHDPTEPDHLIEMSHKIKQLEASYRDSVCSCLNDNGEAQKNLQSENDNSNNKLMMVKFDGGSLTDRHETMSFKAVENLDCLSGESENDDDDDVIKIGRRGNSIIGGISFSGALACGIVLGMAFSGFLFHFQYGHTHHYGNFLTPT
ncbi:hypothetical protein CsatB_018248 [Cannabis sativa]